MAEQSAQPEPSMEEILASIRRIISEDGEDEADAEAEAAPAPSGPKAVEAVADEPEPEPEPEVEFDAVVAEDPEPIEASDQEPEIPAESPFEAPDVEDASFANNDSDDGDDVLDLTDVVPESGPADPIVSHMTEAATSEHLKALSGLMVRNYPGSENTLEGLVREMLKPMLREWLDSNLPTLVEQMVNREIARIAGRDK